MNLLQKKKKKKKFTLKKKARKGSKGWDPTSRPVWVFLLDEGTGNTLRSKNRATVNNGASPPERQADVFWVYQGRGSNLIHIS